jgi:hypothetical protein
MGLYLRFVRATSRMAVEPAAYDEEIASRFPAIVAMWHGEHFMTPFVKRPQDRAAVMISRHGDGEINAGAQRRDQVRKRGGAEALRAMLGALEEGYNVAMTADVPKVSRVAGRGIVVLAQLSGRPIIPLAVVTGRGIRFSSWDRSVIGLPFGRAAIVAGTPIAVPRAIGAAEAERFRVMVQEGLDAVHARAYALAGGRDGGAGRAEVIAARERAAAGAEMQA